MPALRPRVLFETLQSAREMLDDARERASSEDAERLIHGASAICSAAKEVSHTLLMNERERNRFALAIASLEQNLRLTRAASA